MSEALFTVTYDGPELEGGRMDAATLGAAMVAMANLVEHSTSLLYGSSTPVTVEIAADFESGSFSFHALAAVADSLNVGKQIVESVNMNHVLAVLGITGGGGLIAFIKWLGNRKVTQTTPLPGTGNVSVSTEA